MENEGVRVSAMPNCPLCSRPGRVLHENLRDRHWGAPGVWAFRTCGSCGHVWLDPSPLPGDIGKLYTSYFTHGTDRPNPFVGQDLWSKCRRGVMAASGYPDVARDDGERLLGILARRIPPVREECEEFTHSLEGPPRGNLLDAGCGDGFYLRTMHTLGWNVQGLEPDGKAVAIARERGFDVVESTLEEATLPEDAFEVITMSHVIEHVLDPIRNLSKARRLLRPNGTLLVNTPNAASWGHSMFGASWLHLDPPRHCHLFTVKNLVACANRAGLSVVRWTTTGRGHLVFDASRSIRRTGRFNLADPAIRASNRDRGFRLSEQAVLRVRPDIGEEILLFCTKRTNA